MQKLQSGFTLIELMIVVAIIGLIAAIALPVYQDYTKRTRVAEGMLLSGGAKSAIASYYSSHNQLPTNNTQAGIAQPAQITGESVKSVEVDANGNVVVTFKSNVDGGDPTIILQVVTGGGSVEWTCTGGTLLNRYRPSNCR